MEKITGINSLLLDNTKFDEWCESLSSEILNENYLDRKDLANIIKNKITLNENNFYRCICTDLENKIIITKKKAQLIHKSNNKKEYIDIGFVLNQLKLRLKKYNIERTKSYQRNSFYKLKKYLIDNDLESVFNDFKINNL